MCSSVSACILILANIGVLLLGLAITIVGALLQWGRDILTQYIGQGLSIISKTTGVAGPTDTSLTLGKIATLLGEYVSYLSAAGLVIFIFGLVLLGIGVCGVCGACQKSTILLVIYSICVGIILIAMIVLTCLIAFKKNDIKDLGQNFLTKYISNTFVGLGGSGGSNAASAILSLVMARLSCCGVTNSSDFSPTKAPKWNRTYVFPNGTAIELQIPLACCKMQIASYLPENETCLTNPDSANSNMDQGCYSLLWDMIDKYSTYTMYILIAVDALLLILLICASVMIKSNTD